MAVVGHLGAVRLDLDDRRRPWSRTFNLADAAPSLSRSARFPLTTSVTRASSTTNGAEWMTTYWQNEWMGGVSRRDIQGSLSPSAPGNT